MATTAQLTDSGAVVHKFITLKGAVNPLAPTVQNITRAGTDGVGYRKSGKNAATFGMRSIVDVDDAAAAKARILTYRALIGDLVTLQTEDSQVWTNVLVVGARLEQQQPIVTAVGGTEADPDFLIIFQWTFQQTEIP